MTPWPGKTAISQSFIHNHPTKVKLKLTNILNELKGLRRQNIDLIERLGSRKINYYDVTYEEVNHGPMQDRLARVQLLADLR